MDKWQLAKLAVPAVVMLVAVLSYSSQYLFYSMEPGPLDSKQSLIFNVLVGCIWISYTRACTTDPGRVPPTWKSDEGEADGPDPPSPTQRALSRQRYCRKCDAIKPPRSHHCRVCKRSASISCGLRCYSFAADAFRRWTTIAPGLSIVSLTLLFRISCAFYGMPSRR